ncbi:MAG TPA: hypothetical protein PKC14_04485 [Candidatus Absconditabacterales bacterium]|nr:hypothetical protein [Candidatus Absconditabacterales bacterium]
MKKKFLTVLLGVLASVSAQTFAAQSGDSFTTSLFDKKNSLLETLSGASVTLQTKVAGVNKTYNSNADYQTLHCLGISSLDQLSGNTSSGIQQLTTTILEQYVTLQTAFSTYENKVSLGLLSDAEKINTMNGLVQQLTHYEQSLSSSISQRTLQNTAQINSFENDIINYISTNKNLLTEMRTLKTGIESAYAQNSAFQSGVQNFLSGNYKEFSQKLSATQSLPVLTFKKQITGILGTYYSELIQTPGLYAEMDTYTQILIKEYQNRFQEQVATLLDGFVDQKLYASIKSQMISLQTGFVNSGVINCTSILNKKTELTNLLSSISAGFDGLIASLNHNTTQFNNIETINQLIENSNTILKNFHTTTSEEISQKLIKKITERRSLIVTQQEAVQKLFDEQVARKSILENPRVSAGGKEKTRLSIIENCKLLIPQAPTITQKNQIVTFLQSLGDTSVTFFQADSVFRFDQKIIDSILAALEKIGATYRSKTEFTDRLKTAQEKIVTLLTTRLPQKKIVLLKHIQEAFSQYLQSH